MNKDDEFKVSKDPKKKAKVEKPKRAKPIKKKALDEVAEEQDTQQEKK